MTTKKADEQIHRLGMATPCPYRKYCDVTWLSIQNRGDTNEDQDDHQVDVGKHK